MTAHAIDVREASPDRKDPPSRQITRLWLFGLPVAFVVLTVLVWPFDQVLSGLLRLSGPRQGSLLLWFAAQPVKLFGKGDVLFLLGLVLAIHRWKRVAFAACLAVLIAGLIIIPAKSVFERQRPDGRDKRSFPSGDAAAVAAFLVPIATAFPSTRPIAIAGIAAVGLARVAVGRHFPSDILGGIAIGLFVGAVVVSLKVSLRPRVRRFLRRSWLAVGLGLFILLRLLVGGSGDWREMIQFLSIFGPAVGFLAVIPFVRVWFRRGRRETLSAKKRERVFALILAAVIFAGLLFVTTRSTLWDRDEPRFSEATVEMIHSGNHLVPTFNGQLRPDKPILIYWLMSLPVRIFGPTEFACRFFAPVGAALACLLTYYLSFNLFGTGTGLLAMAVLATTPLLLIPGTAATTDAVLLAMMVAAFALFEVGLREGLRKVHTLALGLVLGAALLIKGPVGLVIPVLGIIGILVFGRRFSAAWAKYLLPSILLGIVIFLAWAIPANEATGGEFLRRGIGYHVFARTFRPIDSHGGNYLLFLPFYIPVVILAFFPWTLFLPASLSALAAGRIAGERGRYFLLGWIIPTFFLMSIVSTKLPHYILPIWPAFALAVAGTIKAAEEGALAPRDITWLVRGRWLFGVIGVVGGAGLVVAPWLVPALAFSPPGSDPGSPGLAWSMAGLGCVLLVMTFFGLRECSAKRYRSTAAILAAGAIALMFTITILGLPVVERFKVSKPLADAIRSQTAADVPVAQFDYDEPSLIFYLGRRHLKAVGNAAAVTAWAKEPRPGVLILSRKALDVIESKKGPLGLKEIASARGFNYSYGKWVDLVALGRGLP